MIGSDRDRQTPLAGFSVAQITTQATWNAPASIVFGTLLSSTQLDATASVPGNPVYSPGPGALLGLGAGLTLSVTFTPTEPVDYTTAHASPTITVTPAMPFLSVSAPGGTFDGSPYAAAVTTAGSGGAAPAASLEDVAPSLTYYAGTDTSGAVLGATPPSAPGTYTVVASFPGSADYTATRSAPVTFTITPAATQVVLVPQPVLKIKEVIALGLEAVIQPMAPGAGVPTGTVTFETIVKGKGKKAKATAKVLGTVALSGGSVVLTVKPNSVLKLPITIVYGGDADFHSSTSAPAVPLVEPGLGCPQLFHE